MFGIFSIIQGWVKLKGADGTTITSRDDGAGQTALSVEQSSTNFTFSSSNSTTTNLAAGATFTGPVEAGVYQQALSVLCYSDQKGILTINQYIDAAGLQKISEQITNVYPNVGVTDAPVLNGNYFNASFKNTGTATTTNFSVDIYSGTIPRPIAQNNPVNDYMLNVQRGRITGQSNISMTGYNSSVGTTKEMLWSQSGTYTWKTSASTCTLVSSSASDTAAGVGARTILIEGLNASYAAILEVITLNGTSSVTTVNSFIRVNKLTVTTAGTSRANVGKITMTHTGTIINYITAGDGLSQGCFQTIPAGHTAYVMSGYIRNSKADQSADLYVQVAGVKYKVLKLDINNPDFTLTVRSPYEIPQTADIWLETAAISGTMQATGFLEMILIKDGY